MIVLLSPAKSLNPDPVVLKNHTTPRSLDHTATLVSQLKKKSANSLKKLMGVSDKIAQLNVTRYNDFSLPFTPDNAKPAALTFNGDVYNGLEATAFNGHDLNFAQKHLRILSGLYGVLRPLDLMQAYRLEMGTKLKVGRAKNLYEFWDNHITLQLNNDIAATKSKRVLNLASNEYFHAVKPDQLDAPVVFVQFKEKRNGTYKVISFNAKKARGRMAHLVIKNRIKTVKPLQSLEVNGYRFNKALSEGANLVFTIE